MIGELKMFEIVDMSAEVEVSGMLPEQGIPLGDQRRAIAGI